MSQANSQTSGKLSKASKKRANKQSSNGSANNNNNFNKNSAPSAMNVSTKSSQPSIIKTGRGFRVSHRELVLSSVAGSTGFTVQSFLRLNPGLAATFPWLSVQAAQWEQYCCHKLIAEWVPIAPSSTQGDIILSPNYDASDPQPTTETQAANNFGTVTNSVWFPHRLVMDVRSMMGLGPRRYVRICAVAGDIKTFDIGTLAVCSNNETGTGAIGKLFLDYDFEFFTPQNDPSPATTPLYTSLFGRITSNQTFTTATPAVFNWNSLVYDPLSIGAGSSGTFTPPAGVYRITAHMTFSDSSNEAFTAAAVLLKNGVTLSTPIQTQIGPVTIAVNGTLDTSIEGIVPLNGTDTVAIQVTLIGAAGTLVGLLNYCQLIFSLA